MGVMERKWRRGSRSIHRYAHTLLHMKSVLLIIQANQGSLIIKSFFSPLRRWIALETAQYGDLNKGATDK